MDKYKVEDLAGLAKEFKKTEFGKYLIAYMEGLENDTLRAGMNAPTSDLQVKAINQAAGIRLVSEQIEYLSVLADNPELLAPEKQNSP